MSAEIDALAVYVRRGLPKRALEIMNAYVKRQESTNMQEQLDRIKTVLDNWIHHADPNAAVREAEHAFMVEAAARIGKLEAVIAPFAEELMEAQKRLAAAEAAKTEDGSTTIKSGDATITLPPGVAPVGSGSPGSGQSGEGQSGEGQAAGEGQSQSSASTQT